jgi:hypothetical protein
MTYVKPKTKKFWKTQIETWFGIGGVKIEEERGR